MNVILIEFILGLEKNYPSTVSTILRTSAKVKPKASGSNSIPSVIPNTESNVILSSSSRDGGAIIGEGQTRVNAGGNGESGGEIMEVGEKCILCTRQIQNDIKEWKEGIAIRSFEGYENWLGYRDRGLHAIRDSQVHNDAMDPRPRSLPTTQPKPETETDETDTKVRNPDQPIPFSLTPHLCYVCHTNLTSPGTRIRPRDMNALVPLPIWSGGILVERVERLRLRRVMRDLESGSGGLEKLRVVGGGGGEEEEEEDAKEVMRRRQVGREEMESMVEEFLLDDR